MATYNSSRVSSNKPTPSPAGLTDNLKVLTATVDCSAAPTTADALNFFDVPAGFRVIGGFLKATDMDTNGTPTIALNIGDAGDVDRLFAASDVARAGTSAQVLANTGVGYLYTSKTRITGVASTNAATGAAGSVTLALYGVIEGGAS